MNTHRTLVLTAVGAAFLLGGCASNAGTGSLIPTAVTTQATAVHTETLWRSAPVVTPVPTATPAPTPTPVPTIAPAMLVVTALAPLTVAPGQSSTIPCAVQVTSEDDHGAYVIDAALKSTTGPAALLGSSGALQIAVPDFGTAVLPLATTFPGTKLWSGTLGQVNTHCLDVTITAPASAVAGTYSATVQVTMLENVRAGLYATRATGTATMNATVAAAPMPHR